ncbi:unnamed protein product [Diabrotica balteata]|uniref:C-type lectin domain-containing protein n=1 Tax=Diabrotica balteata TaxID=107213 RepID=A0A9N9T8L4_DIABA|nr:unnamed protein product [Diabrotica balteata]
MKKQILVVLFTILFNVNINNAYLHQSDTSVTPLDLHPQLKFERNGDTLYYFGYTSKGTWLQALQHCKSLGMDLVSIESQEENDFLYERMKENLGKWGGNYRFWSSGIRMDTGDFIWMRTGHPVDFINWLEPLNLGQELLYPYGVELIYGNRDGLKWNVEIIDTERYALCEVNLTQSVESEVHNLCTSNSLSVIRNHFA